MEKNSRKKFPLHLYVHIPFCVKKCAYCDFLSGPAGEKTQDAYVQALKKEIHGIQEGKERPVSSVFIGGGTPSLLEPRHIESVMNQLYKEFLITPDAEITIEANPGTFIPRADSCEQRKSLSREKLRVYRRAGINRLSMGLQSPKDEELQLLGRIHTCRQFLECFYGAREEGFTNINVDLMSALPGQSCEGWAENLKFTAGLGPEHISAYSLIIEEGTPFAKMDLNLPDEEAEYKMYEDTAEILKEYGYDQYEISNYARPGFESRHNSGYWRRREYLGIGLGASSFWERYRFSNTTDMEEYLKNSAFPEKIRQNEELLSVKDEMAEFMFLGLRMTKGISKEEFRKEFGTDIRKIYGSVLEKYEKMALLEEKDGRIFLTRAGIHVSNTVMADFLLE